MKPAESVSITPFGCASRRAVKGWCTVEIVLERGVPNERLGVPDAFVRSARGVHVEAHVIEAQTPLAAGDLVDDLLGECLAQVVRQHRHVVAQDDAAAEVRQRGAVSERLRPRFEPGSGVLEAGLDSSASKLASMTIDTPDVVATGA